MVQIKSTPQIIFPCPICGVIQASTTTPRPKIKQICPPCLKRIFRRGVKYKIPGGRS